MSNEHADRDTLALDPDDRELEQLLSEACVAPPVPRSLRKRIDRAVAAEWRQAPRPVENGSVQARRSPSRVRRWTRSWPVAATLVVVVLLLVVLSPNSRSYGWTAMLDAIAHSGVVQFDRPDGVRWLALSDGLVGEETQDGSRLLDVSRKIVLTRTTGDAQVQRRPLPAAGRDGLAAMFLLGDPFEESEWQRLEGLQVIDENWSRVTDSGRDEVLLRVRLKTATSAALELQMTLDANSQLPLACQVQNDVSAGQTLAFSYPETDVAELRGRAIPVGLTVVDVRDTVEIAASTNDPGNSTETVSLAATNATRNGSDDRDEPPMFGEASHWRPVAVVNRPESEVLQGVDDLLTNLWEEHGITPVAPADDEELLRRVYLDLTGRTPTVHEVRTYLQDPSADRYEALVDRLLNSPDCASHLATVWRTFLIPEGVDLTAFGGVEDFDRWLAERFGDNDGYDEIVRSLLLAEGRLSRSGPLLFYSALKLNPQELAARTARVFLGMRLECAQCHDHPFEPWSQEEFWGFAAFFAQISRPQGKLESVSTVMRVHDVDHGDVMLPDSETVVAPAFLDGAAYQNGGPDAARRIQLARWLTSAKNPYFARATANRVWGHMFGKGVVDPVDDFGSQHQAKSPELIDLLAGHFINTGFNLRELFRTAALSRAYRLSSGAASVDEQRLEWFAQMNVKTLTAEQVYDCITVATLLDSQPAGDDYEFNVVRFGNTDRQVFLQQFRTPAGHSTEYLGGIPQALTLMNGTLIEGATGLSSSGLLKSLEAPFFTNRERIEVLYLATLSRRPRPAEWELLEDYIPDAATGGELQDGLADILWALLNSAEFTLNH